jgi:predicted phage-related endonuclease
MEPLRGIGGSWVAAISGLTPWASPMDVYLGVFGLTQVPENAAMKWGHKLEAVIADEYQERHPDIYLFPSVSEGFDRDDPVIHPKHNWYWGTPDRLCMDIPGLTMADFKGDFKGFCQHLVRGLEIKTAAAHLATSWGEEESDDIPPYYIAQCIWYAALFKGISWDCAVLIGGRDYREYVVQYDPALAKQLFRMCKNFWENHIETKTPPPPDASPAWKEYLAKMFPTGNEEIYEFGDGHWLLAPLREIELSLKDLETQEAKIKDELRNIIGKHDGITGEWPDGKTWKVTWKKSKNTEKMDSVGLSSYLLGKYQVPEEETKQFLKDVPGSRRLRITYEVKEKKSGKK